MDNTKEFTHLGLCAGYGGIELGLHRVIRNLRTVALCEIEAFACANLVSKMETGLMDCAPIWTDLKTFPWAEFRDSVDVLTGGYPCQPFSAAGKRLGTEDPRHLWPFIADGIRILRPKLCFFENVEGHISLGLREVIGELESIGYKTAWGIFSASEVGAPHQRKRVFILAYCKGNEWSQSETGNWWQMPARRSAELANAGRIEPQGWRGAADGQQSGAGGIPRGEPPPRYDQVWPSRPGEPQHGWEPPRVVAHAHGGRGEEPRHKHADIPTEPSGGDGEAMGNANSPRPQERSRQRGAGIQGIDADGGAHADGEIKQPMGDPVDGTPDGLGVAELSGLSHSELAEICEWMVKTDNRTDELRLLGNGVVPATAERAFRVLTEDLFNAIP